MISVLFAAAFAVALGAAFCFVGYRLFMVMLPIWGFFAGFWLGAAAVSLLFGAGFLATLTAWVVGFAAGLVGAVFSYLFYLVGIAIVSAAFGAALGTGLMGVFGFETGLLVSLVALVCAVVVAGLVLRFNIQKYAITAITAIGGANAILAGVLLLLGRVPLGSFATGGGTIKPILQDSWFWLIAWLAVAVIGFVVQIRVNRDYTFSPNQYIEGWG